MVQACFSVNGLKLSSYASGVFCHGIQKLLSKRQRPHRLRLCAYRSEPRMTPLNTWHCDDALFLLRFNNRGGRAQGDAGWVDTASCLQRRALSLRASSSTAGARRHKFIQWPTSWEDGTHHPRRGHARRNSVSLCHLAFGHQCRRGRGDNTGF